MAANEGSLFTNFSNIKLGTASGGGRLFLAGTEVLSTAAELNTLSGVLTGSATINPGSLVDGANEPFAVTVTGAALGDFVIVGPGVDVQDMTFSGAVTAADTVTILLQNESGGTLDLGSSTWNVLVIPK